MSDREKIKEEIERRIVQAEEFAERAEGANDDSSKLSWDFVATQNKSLLQFIDSLPEESGCAIDFTTRIEDLEEAAKEWAENHFQDFIEAEEDPGYWCSRFGFIAGAKWQKQQMMKDAVIAWVNTYENTDDSNYVEFVTEQSPYKFKETEKCKIIIVKED